MIKMCRYDTAQALSSHGNSGIVESTFSEDGGVVPTHMGSVLNMRLQQFSFIGKFHQPFF